MSWIWDLICLVTFRSSIHHNFLKIKIQSKIPKHEIHEKRYTEENIYTVTWNDLKAELCITVFVKTKSHRILRGYQTYSPTGGKTPDHLFHYFFLFFPFLFTYLFLWKSLLCYSSSLISVLYSSSPMGHLLPSLKKQISIIFKNYYNLHLLYMNK